MTTFHFRQHDACLTNIVDYTPDGRGGYVGIVGTIFQAHGTFTLSLRGRQFAPVASLEEAMELALSGLAPRR